jgi:5-methylcytosine-specific restriction protein A
MLHDARSLAEKVSATTGLEFEGRAGRDRDGNSSIELHPAGHPSGQTFSLVTVIGWRRLDIYFQLGNFAGDLVQAMGEVDESGRLGFQTVLHECKEDGAEVALIVNGSKATVSDASIWEKPWRSAQLTLRKGMLDLNNGDAETDERLISFWTSRAAAAILALLPLEDGDDGNEDADFEPAGLPEGAKTRIEVNRYERDRRNRAAALTIHGYACKCCGLDLGERYGSAAFGLIEVHHLTPVSEIGPDYIVNPRTDLIPLCPNCHAVAHRRAPPFSVEEVRTMLGVAELPE